MSESARIVFGALALLLLFMAGCGGSSIPGMDQGNNADNITLGQPTSDFPNNSAPALWDMAALKAAPKVEIIGQSTAESSTGEIVVKEISYNSPSSGGKDLNIFAYYAYPENKADEKLPAIVWVHGGGHRADREASIEWASRGYAAISMDLPGKGGPERVGSRSDGPDISDYNIFNVSSSPKSSWLYPAVNCVCRAISLMANQSQVDPMRIGVLGYSWGGVITLIVNGIDDRVSAACCVFGSGFIADDSFWSARCLKKMPPETVREWRKSYDPSNYLRSQHGKMLFVGATDDVYYPMRSFVRTYEAANCEKSLAFTLNKNHELDEACSNDIAHWFEWALKSGSPFPTLRVTRHKDELKVTVEGSSPIRGASIVTADGENPAKAKWRSRELVRSNGDWTAKLPAADVPYFFTASDDGGRVVAGDVRLPAKK